MPLTPKIAKLSPGQFEEKYLKGKKEDTRLRYVRYYNFYRKKAGITVKPIEKKKPITPAPKKEGKKPFTPKGLFYALYFFTCKYDEFSNEVIEHYLAYNTVERGDFDRQAEIVHNYWYPDHKVIEYERVKLVQKHE
jgi:hypothetical protein